MAFNGNQICTSFKAELLKALHDFTPSTGHTFKLALYDENATLNAETTDYTTDNEVVGTGYTAGGATLTTVEPASSGKVAFTDFADLVFSTVTLTARGALIYNTTTGGGADTTEAVMVLDFGMNRSKTAADLTITFPTPDAINAIIRL